MLITITEKNVPIDIAGSENSLASAGSSDVMAVPEKLVGDSGGEPSFPEVARGGNVYYSAGDQVPAPGSYWVWHKNHREPHAGKVRFTTFPACAQCGHSVRYLPMAKNDSATKWVRRDPDFRHALARRGPRDLPR